MNLHLIAMPLVSAISPSIVGSVLVSTGSTTSADGSQTPAYAAPVTVSMQVQPLSTKDIEHLSSLNIQGVTRSIYVQGLVEGLNRADQKGGDLITFGTDASVPANLQNTTWLVKATLEQWDSSGWVKVAVTRQLSPPEVNA